MTIKLGIASDHGGKQLKAIIAKHVVSKGFEVVDYGVGIDDNESVDYPDFAGPLCSDLISGQFDRGILVCGTGIGMSIAANKIPGIRAALVWDEFTAKMSRLHNNSNVICFGERVSSHHRVVDYLDLWLNTPFEGSRHQRRLDKVSSIEKKYSL